MDDVQGVEELAFILMEALGLKIEDAVRIELMLKDILMVGGKVQFILVLDLFQFIQKGTVVQQSVELG